MKFTIGYQSDDKQARANPPAANAEQAARESVVLVEFPNCGIPLQYYNDRFDLRPGDIVFVEGKYEGVPGRVQKVSTRFKIKTEDYKRVLSVIDTKVSGTFQQTDTHFITFDPLTLPYRQALSWFKAINDENRYFVRFDDEEAFPLDDAKTWPFSSEIENRGLGYYRGNKVVYLSLDDGTGKAVVCGAKAYEVQFQYREGQIDSLTCDCPCGYHCKHEAAVLFQLVETLKRVAKSFSTEYRESRYFAAVDKASFFSFAITNNEKTVVELR